MIKTFWNLLNQPIKIGPISFSFSIFTIVVRFFLPLLLSFIVYKLLLYFARRLIYKPRTLQEDIKKKIYRYTRLVLRVIFFIVVAILVGDFFEAEIQNYLYIFWNVLKQPLFTSGSTKISIITILLAIPVFYIASWTSRVTKRFVDTTLLNRVTIDEDTRFSISTLVRYTVMIIVILIGLSFIGLNLSSLAVLFGVLGIGVGFGLQDTVANFFAGLIIIFERPIKEGDRILVSGLEGDVVHIRLRSTIINTLTNETIVVPNSKLVGNSIHNYSYQDRRIIIVNKIQVSYETNLVLARDVLLGVARTNEFILKYPEPEVRVSEFQDSGILLELWSWIGDSIKKLDAISSVNFAIWQAFRENGIIIPFPQMDVHLKQDIGV